MSLKENFVKLCNMSEQDTELYDECPPLPTKEGYHNDYRQCHCCSKWFHNGRGYYGYGSNPIWIHGSSDYGSYYKDRNRNIIGYTCPRCNESPCTIDNCPCNGSSHYCEMCERWKRGLGKKMHNEHLCIECHKYFMLGKQLVMTIVKHRPSTLEELYKHIDF